VNNSIKPKACLFLLYVSIVWFVKPSEDLSRQWDQTIWSSNWSEKRGNIFWKLANLAIHNFIKKNYFYKTLFWSELQTENYFLLADIFNKKINKEYIWRGEGRELLSFSHTKKYSIFFQYFIIRFDHLFEQ